MPDGANGCKYEVKTEIQKIYLRREWNSTTFKNMQTWNPQERAFTLVELLAVMGILVLMIGATVPAITGLSQGNRLSTAASLVSNMMSVARTEAVTQRALIRFAVVEDWPGNPEANLRKIGIWKSDVGTGDWVLVSKWEDVPQGVAFDPAASEYAGELDTNNLLAEALPNTFTRDIGGKAVVMRYAEFTPTGSVNLQGMTDLDVWMALALEQSSEDANWAKISTSVLTGRIKITRP